MGIQLKDFMELVTGGDFIQKVIRITGEINTKRWAIVNWG